MLSDLNAPSISKEIDRSFLTETVRLLEELRSEIHTLAGSSELEVDALMNYNTIRYTIFQERIVVIELFRYLVIVNYGKPEEYFKKKIARIYNEINCMQKQPIVTTISNSENYYWALPGHNIIAVPTGEHRNLLNLPDLYHEIGHLIYNQYESYLKGSINNDINKYYLNEIQRVTDENRDPRLIPFFKDKNARWLSTWVMEFTCDFIATYLVGPAYGWTNLKLTTVSGGKDRVYADSLSHPSDESRMRGIFFMLRLMEHNAELTRIEKCWNEFLGAMSNTKPANYEQVLPQTIIEQLAKNVFAGCQKIDLRIYGDQVKKFGNPISKILNDTWQVLLDDHTGFDKWEEEQITMIGNNL
jgi:hypothetical protein